MSSKFIDILHSIKLWCTKEQENDYLANYLANAFIRSDLQMINATSDSYYHVLCRSVSKSFMWNVSLCKGAACLVGFFHEVNVLHSSFPSTGSVCEPVWSVINERTGGHAQFMTLITRVKCLRVGHGESREIHRHAPEESHPVTWRTAQKINWFRAEIWLESAIHAHQLFC